MVTAYLFTIFNAFQGMFIFIFLCVLSRKVSVLFLVGGNRQPRVPPQPGAQPGREAVSEMFYQSKGGHPWSVDVEEEGGEIFLLPFSSVETEPLSNFYLLTYFLTVLKPMFFKIVKLVIVPLIW